MKRMEKKEMKKNYSSSTTTVSGFKLEPKNATFKKAADMIGKYEKGKYEVCGYIKSTKGKYGESFSLAIKEGSNAFYINIPQWLGQHIEKDFLESGQSADEYFSGASIQEIAAIATSNGTTYEITFDV